MRFLQAIHFLFLFTGCVSSYQLTIPVAPDYYISPSDRNILIGTIKTDSSKQSKEPLLDFDSLKQRSLVGAYERLKNLKNVQLSQLDSIADSLSYPIESLLIDSLFKLSGANSLLLLTDLNVKTESSYGIFKNEFGRVVSGDQFFFEIHTKWRMYFKQDATFEDFDHYEYLNYDSFTNYYDNPSSDKVKGKIFAELSALSYFCGQAFTDKFFPQQNFADVYLWEIPKLRLGNDYLRQGKTIEARNKYLEYTEGNSTKTQAKAYYNLAICFESEQNYPEAIRCAKKAQELDPKNYHIINLNTNLPLRKQDYDTFKALGN